MQFEIFFCSDLISAELKIKVYFLAFLPDTLTHLFLPYILEYLPTMKSNHFKNCTRVFKSNSNGVFGVSLQFLHFVLPCPKGSYSIFYCVINLCFICFTLSILGEDFHVRVCILMVIWKYVCKNFKWVLIKTIVLLWQER